MKHTLKEKFRNAVAIAREYSEEIICATLLGCLVLHTIGYFIRSIKM